MSVPVAEPIRIWNRALGREETEQVYGDAALRLVYGSAIGQRAAESFLTGPLVSRLYGRFQDSPLSRRKIQPFIRQFAVPMEEYEPGPFDCFNDFFARRFRPGARIFTSDPAKLAAFAEARYLAFASVTDAQVFPVKGEHLSARALLGASAAAHAKRFEGGPLLLARLCPVDYHRFHFPDSGKVRCWDRVAGKLHSVNPLALRYRSDIFATNERQVSVLETDHFGMLAYIEVGALCVGKIVQSHPSMSVVCGEFKRGEEKGHFLFGASTVIVLGEPGRWVPSRDLLDQTARGRETLVRLGEPVGEVAAAQVVRS